MPTDYYELLGVSRDASDEDLKRAYRQLARELHPDANGGDTAAEARFKEVSTAYETLRDPERRHRYDMFGPNGERMGAAGAGFGPTGFGDLFEAFFGGANPFTGQRPTGPRRGDDVEALLELRFEEAVFGINRSISYRGALACEACTGSGAKPGTSPLTCVECAGIGQVRRVRQSILGQVVTTVACPRCQGIGEIIESPCHDCGGQGRRLAERSVEVEVPPGVDEGTTLRISGAGGAPLHGGVNGDLYMHLRVQPHDRFARAGDDLVTELPVALTQAALGTKITLETLDGAEQVTIPAGTQSGWTFRMKGRGVPHVRGHGRGDLRVQVVVETPTGLTKEQEELLRKLAEQRGEELATPEPGLISRIRSSFA